MSVCYCSCQTRSGRRQCSLWRSAKIRISCKNCLNFTFIQYDTKNLLHDSTSGKTYQQNIESNQALSEKIRLNCTSLQTVTSIAYLSINPQLPACQSTFSCLTVTQPNVPLLLKHNCQSHQLYLVYEL